MYQKYVGEEIPGKDKDADDVFVTFFLPIDFCELSFLAASFAENKVAK